MIFVMFNLFCVKTLFVAFSCLLNDSVALVLKRKNGEVERDKTIYGRAD